MRTIYLSSSIVSICAKMRISIVGWVLLPSEGYHLTQLNSKGALRKTFIPCHIIITTNGRYSTTAISCEGKYLLAITGVITTTSTTHPYRVVRTTRMPPNQMELLAQVVIYTPFPIYKWKITIAGKFLSSFSLLSRFPFAPPRIFQ